MKTQKVTQQQAMPQEERRVTLKWSERNDEILALKRIEIMDIFTEKPLSDTEDRDIASRLRAQLPDVPMARRLPYSEAGAQEGGIFVPFVLGMGFGSILMASIRIVTWIAA